MLCSTCNLPIAPDAARITDPTGTYHAPVPVPQLNEDGTPILDANGEPLPPLWEHATCPPVVEPGPPAPPPTPAVTSKLSVLEFTTRRFTPQEQIRIEIAQELHPDAEVRAMLRLLDKQVNRPADKLVDVSDPRTQYGVQYLTTVMFQGSLLLEPSRVAAVLAPKVLE